MKKTTILFTAATLLLSSYNAKAQDYDNDGTPDSEDTEIYWTGTTSSNFTDATNWAGKTPDFGTHYNGDYYIGSGANECTIGNASRIYLYYITEGGVLNVNGFVNADRFKSTAGESSDVYINDGGTIDVRNGSEDNQYNGGNIHVLTGGTLQAKSNWRWGREPVSEAKMYVKGGTVKLAGIIPWRLGVSSNTARIIVSNNGVIEHPTAATLEGWANDKGIYPAEGSLLTHKKDSLKIGSVDVTLPSSYEVTSETTTYTVPDFSSMFANYSTGDTYANATITVTQDVAAGTELTTQIVVNVTATDYFNNTVTKAIDVAQEGQLSVEDNQISQTNLTTTNSHVYVTNVNEVTKVSVYSLTGALVKSVTTSTNTNFTLNSGIYIAKIESEKTGAKKTVKFIVK
ncbi:T9SS type A sorting domain-containing protein [Wenyingzhuangia sp. IMCC45467]